MSAEPVDLGLLAELMLFYGRVHVLTDHGMLVDLIRKVGAEELVELVATKRLEVTFLGNGLGVRTDNVGSNHELHQPAPYHIGGHSALQDAAPQAFQQVVQKSGRGRRLAQRFSNHVTELTFDETVSKSTVNDYINGDYMLRAVRALLRYLAPEYRVPDDLEFRVEQQGDFLRVETNIDFAAANRRHHTHYSVDFSTLTPAHLLSHVLNANGDLYLGALYSSELATDPLSESLIEAKCTALLAGRRNRAADMEDFQSLLLRNGHAVADAVNSGERTMRDVLRLLESADRFREWLQQQEPSEGVVAEYYRQVTEGTWVTSLPAKLVRWSLAVGVGLAVGGFGVEGIALGAGLSALDMFVLERFVRGWRPDQFVEGKLMPFVDQDR